MDAEAAFERTRDAPLSAEQLRDLGQRSDARGLRRLLGHLLALGLCAVGYGLAVEHDAALGLRLVGALLLGFTQVTFFAAMHECVHRTAFQTRWLNDAVAWFAGLLSFYNSSFYRPYHGWHHRYTQLLGQDPELEDEKPTTLGAYVRELSGVPWWLGKLRTYAKLARGKTGGYGFLNPQNSAGVVRSVRLQLGVYAGAVALGFALGQAYFVTYWLVPVVLAQPLLRAILLAEHMGCSNDADMLANTRTTYTIWPVRFLMWEMPYHADHHRYPALPFFALARAHAGLEPYLAHVARRGYLGLHAGFVKTLAPRSAPHDTST
jgi:fatty acid desaturase